MWKKLKRIFKHRWLDEADTRKAVPADMLERLRGRVAASEVRHSGEIRICVEAGLPFSDLWRYAGARERAVTLFGKLRVWDTEHNNGVLIYLLLADRSIEVVADRGLNQHVSQPQWQAMVGRLGKNLGASQFEAGLTQALEEVSAVLAEHFAQAPGEINPNELDDSPVLR